MSVRPLCFRFLATLVIKGSPNSRIALRCVKTQSGATTLRSSIVLARRLDVTCTERRIPKTTRTPRPRHLKACTVAPQEQQLTSFNRPSLLTNANARSTMVPFRIAYRHLETPGRRTSKSHLSMATPNLTLSLRMPEDTCAFIAGRGSRWKKAITATLCPKLLNLPQALQIDVFPTHLTRASRATLVMTGALSLQTRSKSLSPISITMGAWICCSTLPRLPPARAPCAATHSAGLATILLKLHTRTSKAIPRPSRRFATADLVTKSWSRRTRRLRRPSRRPSRPLRRQTPSRPTPRHRRPTRLCRMPAPLQTLN